MTMSPKQAAFREEYRSRIERWYNGPVHCLVIYAIGGGALAFFISQMNQPIRWWQWAVIPVVFLISNILEWAMHLYVMHRPHKNPIARAIYRRHTLMHHQFFTETDHIVKDMRDLRIVLFPPYTEIGALALAAPGSLILGLLLGANAGWLSMCTVVSLYMIYEFFHLCCHVPDNWFVRHAPFVNTIRRHHAAHHDQSIMMHRNMNLTFPIADWMFGTSDLNRSLPGVLFNGGSTKYVRTDMPRTSRRPALPVTANPAHGR